MRERPALFAASMSRAVQREADPKTQTRRVAKWRNVAQGLNLGFSGLCAHRFDPGPREWWALASRRGDSCWEERCEPTLCPYGVPGDRLWGREAWRTVAEADHLPPRELTPAHRIWYEADGQHQPGFGKLRPSMFMPRWASRILLEITEVRVERLQDISEADAIAEGIERSGNANWRDYLDHPYNDFTSARRSYRSLWEQINGPGSWEANPWVWVVSFRRLHA